MQVNCLVCNKIFKTDPCNVKNGGGKFCSRKCYGKWSSKNKTGSNAPRWTGGKVKLICIVCKKEFTRNKCEIEKNTPKFCSQKCFGIERRKNNIKEKILNPGKDKIKKICEICEKIIYVNKSEEKRGVGRFCSYLCYGLWQKKNRTGENGYNWKGGKIESYCNLCNEKFFIKPSKLNHGRGKFCSRKCLAIYQIKHQEKKETLIEKLIEQELIKRNIKFIKQFPMPGIGVIDFVIPEKRIAIEADGDYWHRLPSVIKRDANKDLKLSFSGYKTYRFWEKDIKKSPSICINKIKEL